MWKESSTNFDDIFNIKVSTKRKATEKKISIKQTTKKKRCHNKLGQEWEYIIDK